MKLTTNNADDNVFSPGSEQLFISTFFSKIPPNPNSPLIFENPPKPKLVGGGGEDSMCLNI